MPPPRAGFEGPDLFRMLPLEGLHLFRVLSLKILLLRKMLPLRSHLSRRLLAHERLRFLLMPPHEFRRLLSVILLDSLPVAAGARVFGRGLGTLLIFLQVLALERRRFRIVLLLKLPQLRGLGARRLLLLLRAAALDLLQLDVVMIAQSFLLLAMLTRYRLAHRVLPFGIMLHRPGRSFCAHQWRSRLACLSSKSPFHSG